MPETTLESDAENEKFTASMTNDDIRLIRYSSLIRH